MVRERDRGRDTPEPTAGDETESGEDARRSGPLENMFQEAVRRAAGMGFSSFFLTEAALRRAFAENAPKDLVDYVSTQGDELRDQVIERVTREFGEWLEKVDLRELLAAFADEYEIKLDVRVSATPKETQDSSLKVVPRRK